MLIKFLNKADADSVLPKLFDILYSNMSKIAPTGKSYEEDFLFWLSCVRPSLEKDPRQILLIYDEGNIVGFFQYYLNNRLFMMEEIQFADEHKGKGVFQMLYRYLAKILPTDTEFVEAYAAKQNKKSIAILYYLGLEIIGENKNKVCYHFRGRYENILRRL